MLTSYLLGLSSLSQCLHSEQETGQLEAAVVHGAAGRAPGNPLACSSDFQEIEMDSRTLQKRTCLSRAGSRGLTQSSVTDFDFLQVL